MAVMAEPPCPTDVLDYTEPTDGYMCPLSANTYGIEFNSFRIRDYETQEQLFEVVKDPNMPSMDLSQIPPEMEDQVRSISYDFGEHFLGLEAIGTTLEFSVGPREVEDFRMIERHYFRYQLLQNYDFSKMNMSAATNGEKREEGEGGNRERPYNRNRDGAIPSLADDDDFEVFHSTQLPTTMAGLYDLSTASMIEGVDFPVLDEEEGDRGTDYPDWHPARASLKGEGFFANRARVYATWKPRRPKIGRAHV